MEIKKVIKMLIKQGPFAVFRAVRDHAEKKEKKRNSETGCAQFI